MTRRSFFGDRRGNVVVLTGFMIVLLVGTVGLAVDATRAWMVRSRLATALDAAALSAARAYSIGGASTQLTQIRIDACGVFWANFGRTGANPCAAPGGVLDTTTFSTGYLGAAATNPNLPDPALSNVLSVTARATLNTTFMRVLGINSLPVFTAAAAATRIVASLEVAMALDVTGSMSPIASGSSVTKIQALRTAGQSFVDTIYSGSETRERMWVSVVPYTTHVSLGNSAYARNMVTQASRDLFTPGGLPLRDTRGDDVPWPGCIEVRYQAMGGTFGDLTDTPPTSDATRYRAWFYPSSLDSTASPNSLYWRQNGGTRNYVAGDNDWRSYILGNTAVNNRAINEWALNQNTARGADVVTGGTAMNPLDITGPNLGCLLHSRYAVLPLTAERTTVRNRIGGLFPDPWLYHMWNTGTSAVWLGGTTVHVGLHAAWTTISPNWQGLWSDAPQTVPLPLATADAGIKAIVLMTDGVNTLGDINVRLSGTDGSRGAPAACGNGTAATTDNAIRNPRHPVGCPTAGTPNYTTTTGYGPYGRWSVGNLRVTSNGVATGGSITVANSATPELDRRLARLCTVIKAAGIEIYVVGFDIASAGGNTTAVRALLTACATRPTDYFDATGSTALNNAFISIANRIARVRLVQ